MIKKFALLSTALIALGAAPAHAQSNNQPADYESLSPLSGFYLGGFGGYSWTDVDTAGPDLDVNGGDYGLFVGYSLDTLLDRTLGMGLNGSLEFHYAWSDADDSTTIGGINVETEKDHEWGISFRPGLSFVDDYTLGLKPYGIIGYRNAEFEATGAGISGDENYDGFELGLGTELMAMGDFGVRVDYSHVWYGEENGIDPSEDDLRLGLAYHF